MNKDSVDLEDMMKVGIDVQLIEQLLYVGWDFKLSVWEDRHKFDKYHELHFKSPNMRKPASIHHSYFGEMTREYLFKREASAVAHDWADGAFNDKLVIQNPIATALEEYFINRKDCRFDNIWSSEVDFQVKVTPKNKTKPKKLKVTITIE